MGTRDATLHPFRSDSVWNLPIGTGATFADTTDLATRDFIATNINGMNIGTWANWDHYSHPISFASTSDPWATVTGRLMAHRDPPSTPRQSPETRERMEAARGGEGNGALLFARLPTDFAPVRVGDARPNVSCWSCSMIRTRGPVAGLRYLFWNSLQVRGNVCLLNSPNSLTAWWVFPRR